MSILEFHLIIRRRATTKDINYVKGVLAGDYIIESIHTYKVSAEGIAAANKIVENMKNDLFAHIKFVEDEKYILGAQMQKNGEWRVHYAPNTPLREVAQRVNPFSSLSILILFIYDELTKNAGNPA